MQLIELPIGRKAKITVLAGGAQAYRKRLISLGLIPGTELHLARKAPLGDPIEIMVRGFCVSLRKHEASILQVEELP